MHFIYSLGFILLILLLFPSPYLQRFIPMDLPPLLDTFVFAHTASTANTITFVDFYSSHSPSTLQDVEVAIARIKALLQSNISNANNNNNNDKASSQPGLKQEKVMRLISAL